MKKFICFLALMCFFLGCVRAEITIDDGGYAGKLWNAAARYGAECAYSGSDATVYYIADGSVHIDGAYNALIAELPQDADYPAIAADADGRVYVLKNDKDETAKPAVICLAPDNGRYYALEYAMPGAGESMKLDSLYISDLSSAGYMFSTLKGLRLFSAVGVYWGTLTGYDEFILIDAQTASACVIPAESCFDAYGFANDFCDEMIAGISSGRYISPEAALVSPDGQNIALVSGSRVFVLDAVTCDITETILPEGFSGSIGWDGVELYGVQDSGERVVLDFSGNTMNSWAEASDFGWDTGFDADWGAYDGGLLDDWS